MSLQIEGILKLEEVAEGGMSTYTLFSNKSMLWIKDRIQDAPCPNSLRFNFSLPTTYSDRDKTYVGVQVGFRSKPSVTCHVSFCHQAFKLIFQGSRDSGHMSATM